jgi:hypothetical protein
MVALIVIGACGTDDQSSTATTMAPTTITTTAVSTNDLAEGSGCTPGTDHLPDGEWFGEVVEADAGELEFDLACWFVGDAAIAAAAEDGERLEIDYYLRNVSTRTRRLPIADDTPVVWYGMGAGDPSNPDMISYADWRVFELEHICCAGVWLTVDAGVVTRIQEQWVA